MICIWAFVNMLTLTKRAVTDTISQPNDITKTNKIKLTRQAQLHVLYLHNANGDSKILMVNGFLRCGNTEASRELGNHHQSKMHGKYAFLDGDMSIILSTIRHSSLAFPQCNLILYKAHCYYQ
jgi:hypothetical protein